MSKQSVVGVYDNISKAEKAVRALDEAGLPMAQVSIIAKDLESQREVHGFITAGDVGKGGAAAGAWVGGLFGLLVGAAFLWIPGFGPLLVAGPLATALLGGIEGTVAGAAGGGLLGALAGWGISRNHALEYERTVRGGKYLVIVQGSAEEVVKAHGVLQDSRADEVTVHALPSA